MMSTEESTITQQLAGFIADELGDAWRIDTSDDFAGHRSTYLDGPDGARLSISLDWRNADRVKVYGVYPRHEKYGVEHHEIGVGRDRGPAVIAREITRRLLPTYLAELTDVRNDNAERVQMRAARATLAQKLAEIIGGTIDSDDDRSTSTRVRWYDNERGYGHVQISYRADSISELEVRSASVPSVIAALQALNTPNA